MLSARIHPEAIDKYIKGEVEKGCMFGPVASYATDRPEAAAVGSSTDVYINGISVVYNLVSRGLPYRPLSR